MQTERDDSVMGLLCNENVERIERVERVWRRVARCEMKIKEIEDRRSS